MRAFVFAAALLAAVPASADQVISRPFDIAVTLPDRWSATDTVEADYFETYFYDPYNHARVTVTAVPRNAWRDYRSIDEWIRELVTPNVLEAYTDNEPHTLAKKERTVRLGSGQEARAVKYQVRFDGTTPAYRDLMLIYWPSADGNLWYWMRLNNWGTYYDLDRIVEQIASGVTTASRAQAAAGGPTRR